MSEPRPKPVRGVLFDLDGTLTVPAIDFGAIRLELGLDEGPILEHLDRLPQAERRRGHAILARHEAEAARRSRWSPGARELLKFLGNSGIRVGVVTRNSRASVAVFAERHGVRFDAVVTREDARPKPDPAPLLLALERLGLARDEAIFVGDFEFDRLAGEAAGIRTYIVQNTPEPRDHGPPEWRLRRLSGVIDVVKGLTRA